MKGTHWMMTGLTTSKGVRRLRNRWVTGRARYKALGATRSTSSNQAASRL